MKPAPFRYHAPASVEALRQLLATLEDVKLLAGGQSLMPMMNFRYVAPEHVIDLNRIASMSGIEINDDLVTIGAMTRQHMLLEHADLSARCPLISAALANVGHVATRNRGTLGGSLAHLDPAAELPAVMSALEATLTVGGPGGSRTVSIADWSLDYMTPCLEDGEYLETVQFKLPRERHGCGFREVARRHGDFALAGSACQLTFDDANKVTSARVVVFGLDVAPVRLVDAEACLTGHAPTDALIREAATATADLEVVVEDIHASADYRQQIAGVMVRRALQDAITMNHSRRP